MEAKTIEVLQVMTSFAIVVIVVCAILLLVARFSKGRTATGQQCGRKPAQTRGPRAP